MGRRQRALTDRPRPAMLLRVRSLVFESLERRSMLAADTESLEGVDPTAAIEPVAAFPGSSVEEVAEQFEPQIAVCWFRPVEILPDFELPVLLEPPTVDPDTGVQLWDGVSLEVIRDGSDDGFPTMIHESDPESGEPEIVTCGGVIDWESPFPWFSADDGSEPTFELSGPPETGDECYVGEPDAWVVEFNATEDPVEKTVDADTASTTGDDVVFDPVAYPTMVRPVFAFARSATAAGGSQVVPVAWFAPADDGVAFAADVIAADAAVNAAADVAAPPATAAVGQADMSRLFAAFAQGLGQGAVDHPAASTVGGRRGARR